MMRLREFRIGFQLTDQAIVSDRLSNPHPGKERDQEKHRDNWNVVRRGADNPELVPVGHHKRS